MMTSTQVVETSVTVTDNSPLQDYFHSGYRSTRPDQLFIYLFTDLLMYLLQQSLWRITNSKQKKSRNV